MVSGVIRYWPKGRDYSNQLVQVYLKIGSVKYIFNGYMKPAVLEKFINNVRPHSSDVRLVEMTARENRNMFYNNYKGWCVKKKLSCSTKTVMFVAQVQMALLPIKRQDNKFVPIVADLSNLTEIQLEMDI